MREREGKGGCTDGRPAIDQSIATLFHPPLPAPLRPRLFPPRPAQPTRAPRCLLGSLVQKLEHKGPGGGVHLLDVLGKLQVSDPRDQLGTDKVEREGAWERGAGWGT